MWHTNSQHSYGHPGKIWKQLKNCIKRSTRKEFISPHLFLHFYIFENRMDSPRFCKHCSKCSCVSHCKNPCSDLKMYIHKKRTKLLRYHNFRQLFLSRPWDKKKSEELHKTWYLVISHSLLTCFFTHLSIPSLIKPNLDAELTISFIYKPINLLKYSAFLKKFIVFLEIEERTNGVTQETD